MRRMLGDKSDQYLNEKKGCINFIKQKMLFILEKLSRWLFLDKIPIFNPENILKIIFNIMTVAYSCFYLFITTLKIFFVAKLGVYDHYLHLLAEIVWVIEMFVQMNTAMYYKNQFTKDRRLIMKIYLEEYLFFEILPLIFDNLSSTNPILRVCYKLPLLLKTKGILQNLKYIEFYILQKLENHSILFLLKMITSLLMFAHIVSCSFSGLNAISITFYNEHTDWTTTQEDFLSRGDWFEHYLWAVNWSLNIMFSNYNKQPQSKLEIGFTCICMIVSCIGFGYIVSSIGSVLSDIDKEQKEYKQDLNILNQFMKRKQIDISLVRRVNIHLKKYYDHKRKVNYIEESKALQKLSDYMSKELQIAANIKILKRFPMFNNLFSEQTQYKICTIMKEKLYFPNQIILDLKHLEQSCLYLIVQGNVSIDHPSNMDENNFDDSIPQVSSFNQRPFQSINRTQNEENKVKSDIILKKDQCFGQYGFFTGSEQITLATSIKFTTIITINREDLLPIIKENKCEFEKFMEIKDNILLERNFSTLMIPCQCCYQSSHDSNFCPFTHKTKDPYFQFKGAFKNQQQERSDFPLRRHRLNIKNIKQQPLIHDKAYKFVIDYGLFEFFDKKSADIEDCDEEEESQQEPEQSDFIFKKREKQKTYFYNLKQKKNQKDQSQSEKNSDDSEVEDAKITTEQSQIVKQVEYIYQHQKQIYIFTNQKEFNGENQQNTEKNASNSKSCFQDEEVGKDKRSSFIIKQGISNFENEVSEINNESEQRSKSFNNLKRCSIEKDCLLQNYGMNALNIIKNNEQIAKNLCSNIYTTIFSILNKTIPKMYSKFSQQSQSHQQNTENIKNEENMVKLNSFEEVIQNRQQRIQQRKITFQEMNQQNSQFLNYTNTSGSLRNYTMFSTLPNINSNKINRLRQQNSKIYHSKNSQDNQFTSKEEIDFLFINGIDKMYSFFNYFPQHNYQQVITRLSEVQNKLIEKPLYTTNKKKKNIIKLKTQNSQISQTEKK